MSDGKDGFDLCGYCCKWADDMDGKSPATVRDAYPKMMRKVLVRRFGMSKDAARAFIEDACCGNWDRLHETRVERAASAAVYADMLRGEVWYCSDRWSWDRVIRVQWLYQRLRDHVGKEADEWQ